MSIERVNNPIVTYLFLEYPIIALGQKIQNFGKKQ